MLAVLLLVACSSTPTCDKVKDCEDGGWCDRCTWPGDNPDEGWYECAPSGLSWRFDNQAGRTKAAEAMLQQCVPSLVGVVGA